MISNLGLVMVGGGSRSAYQAGVTRALYEILKKDLNLFNVISGTSAGAINATYLAANSQDWNTATQNLISFWEKIKPSDVFDLRKKTISDIGLRWVSGATLGGILNKPNRINYLLDTKPLYNLLSKEIDFEAISRNIKKGYFHGISLSTTNYNSGSNVIFYEGKETIGDWSRSNRFSHRTLISIEHLMASSAIPFFFPPMKIGASFYGDGCIRQHTPLSPALHLGAKKIIAIGVRHQRSEQLIKGLSTVPFNNPTIGQIVGVLLNAIFMDSLEYDVERIHHINSIIAEGSHPEFKHIPVFMINPSRDLGKMTKNINVKLPGILRYLLKGIGVSENEGLDLLSYLAFDSSYTKPLIDLGYEDTLKNKNEILKFVS